jgi:hypothetical protein
MRPDVAFGENLHALISSSHYSSLLLLVITYVGGVTPVWGCAIAGLEEKV